MSDPNEALVEAIDREKLEAWAFNVALECSREEAQLEVAIGGAILDLRDLKAILDAAIRALDLREITQPQERAR